MRMLQNEVVEHEECWETTDMLSTKHVFTVDPSYFGVCLKEGTSSLCLHYSDVYVEGVDFTPLIRASDILRCCDFA